MKKWVIKFEKLACHVLNHSFPVCFCFFYLKMYTITKEGFMIYAEGGYDDFFWGGGGWGGMTFQR